MDRETFCYAIGLALVCGFGLGAGVMDMAHERKAAQVAELPRKVSDYRPAVQLIDCSTNGFIEHKRICFQRKRSAEVGNGR
jgi:hypothetical protein